MANLVTGALGSLIPKLGELLKEEYNLQTGMKKRIEFLTEELESAQAALQKVEIAPWDQLDEQVQIWARQVREASYDMEDKVDTFLVCVKSLDIMVRHEISVNTNDIMSHLEEVTERCRRYKVGDIAVAMPDTASAVDPRLHAMYNQVEDLVGLNKSSSELISMLQPLQRNVGSNLKMKIVSIFGVCGLGKTTLAKAVYDEHKGDFDCRAFVPVGRNPDLKEVLKAILMDVDWERRLKLSTVVFDERQLIDELRFFLKNKRYFIVVDDIWEIPSWERIKLAIGDDNNCGARIVITTRKWEVAEKAEEVYKPQPLPDDSSRELFFIRIGGLERKFIDNEPDEVTLKFLKKCAGILLAIITMASLLVGKPRERWPELYRSIDFGSEDNDQAKNTMKIVSFSYYDLPPHLRTCLLYLSAFPEDSIIPKDSLVWMWVAEGFVKKKQGMRSFETGERYFHDLINRSMLEAVKSDNDDNIITGCRVHDMVLDFISSMSHKENFFSVVLGNNDQGTLLESSNVPRRLAHHNRTMVHDHCQGDDMKMANVMRSLFAIRCGIEASDPFHGFRLLRVLVIDNCKATNGRFVLRLEHVTHLLHLRFLSIRGASVERIPQEVRCLRFLQTLDLQDSSLEERPSPGSFPEQLVCLFLPIRYGFSMHSNDEVIFLLTRLTSLEELSICISGQKLVSWPPPKELRVLQLCIYGGRVANERHFWEWVHHLNKLEHLTISGYCSMDVTDFVLPSRLRHFGSGGGIEFCKVPSCLPNLSHLELSLQHMEEHDLKILGMLPELRFLGLELWTNATVSSVVVVSEKDAAVVYFPKLWCCRLENGMVSFHANEEDKSISSHVWGRGHSKDKLQRPILSCSTGGGGGGGASASATAGGAPRDRFMPCLQVFRFSLLSSAWDNYCCDNLGWEYGLPSLRKISVSVGHFVFTDKITAALRSAAEAHPNHPVFRVEPRK